MSFSRRLIHALVIERKRSADPDLEDEYGQAVPMTALEYPIKGLPQPKAIGEVVQASQAGAEVGDWTVFIEPTDLAGADAIIHRKETCPVAWPRDLPDMRFEITGIRNAAGIGHHYEVDAKAVQGAAVLEAGS